MEEPYWEITDDETISADVEIIQEEVCLRCKNMTPWQDCKNCLLARAMERIAKGDKPHTAGYATGQ